jgi:hypothetical protein
MTMTEPNRLETTEPVTIFAIPEAKRESTLRAINAINDLGGDIFTVPSKADAAGTTSGTMCTFSSGSAASTSDYVCTDSDT